MGDIDILHLKVYNIVTVKETHTATEKQEVKKMKEFRIYYKTIGVTTKVTPEMIVKADNADRAVEIFKLSRPWSNIVAIFAD